MLSPLRAANGAPLLALLLVAAPRPSVAATPPEAASTAHGRPSAPTAGPALRVDFELDPLAYALAGHSVHLGLGTGHFRFDLGAFGLDLPAWADAANPHGDFDVSFAGFGAKAHVFLHADGTGPFAGLGAGYVHTVVQRRGTSLASRDAALGAGVEVGWLIPLYAGLYAKPWLGVNATFGADDVELDGARYSPRRLQLFPTVHLGYAF